MKPPRALLLGAVLVVGALALVLMAGRNAPARLVAASPAAGDRLTSAPHEIRLVFDGRVDAGRSHVAVTTADGRLVSAGSFAVTDDTVVLPVDISGSGGYRVDYHAVLDDGPVSGELGFGINDDAPLPATGHQHAASDGPNVALLAADALLITVALVVLLRGPRVRRAHRWVAPPDL
ncbi:methionine-rich copper-binding protein CopC [Asanoa ferruginea]|uniref:Methionine-rich copper-binding protein CopC n=1 Tax=Asanoa ferruginea TaxID=53367 RepID=A0A3D9ZQG0_9ACTN|nr:copper resistance CopC family protein [Asanoa ferruginea]REF98874.1 methionine-rich copper-binding protein CopC [Asanoa ferruginea]GIF46444.1 hypothetical protein Afe04nite_09830 [Asanoa ferruginea]